MPENFIVSDQSQSGRKRAFAVLLCVVFLLLPAVFLHFYLDSYLQEQLEDNIDLARENTRTELALLQKELDLEEVVRIACENFRRLAQAQTGEKSLNPETCTRLEKVFRQNLPASSPMIWINSADEFVATNAPEFAGGRKVWESIARNRSNRGSRIDERIADNLAKTSISPNLDRNFFNQLSEKPIQIIFRGKRYLVCLIPIRNRQKQKLGSVFAFLPLFDRKRDWLEKRAIRKFKQKGLQVGIFKTSDSADIETSDISVNELHGFLGIFASGRNYHIQNDHVYCFSFLAEQKDWFVCIGSQLHHNSKISPENIKTLKIAAYLPFILGLTTLLFFYDRFQQQQISIKTRFWLTTLALAILPTMVMIIIGIMNSHLLRPEIDRQHVEKLRNQIDSVKEKSAYQLTVLESIIANDLDLKTRNVQFSDDLAENLAREYEKFTCQSVFIFRRNGDVFYATNLSDVKKNSQTRFLVGLMEMELRFFGFDFETISKKYQALIDNNSIGNLNRSFYYNRLIPIELGASQNYLFTRLIKDNSGNIRAMVALTFDKFKLNQQLFAEILEETSFIDTRLFVKKSGISPVKPASEKVNEILELAAFSREEFISKLSFKSRQYLILGKHLENLDLAIVGVTRLKSVTGSLYQMFMLALLSTLLLAAIIASYSLQTLRNQLLKPIEKLSVAVEELRNGILGKEIEISNKDEISQLTRSFNRMSNGLKEKAEMARFLNKDLTSNSFLTQSFATRKIEAAILFAGIRNFTSLEALLSPEESFGLMNSFLSTCETNITEKGGQIDKFIGDTIMSFFEHESGETAIGKAADCALSLQQNLGSLNASLPERKKFSFGIGIAFGKVISGAIGSRKNRLDYTLIGDPVNLAARLEKLAGKAGRPSILLALNNQPEWPNFSLEEVKITSIKGKEKAVRVFSIKRKC